MKEAFAHKPIGDPKDWDNARGVTFRQDKTMCTEM